jgi:hypothetical protein
LFNPRQQHELHVDGHGDMARARHERTSGSILAKRCTSSMSCRGARLVGSYIPRSSAQVRPARSHDHAGAR